MAGGHADPSQLDPDAIEWDAVVIGTGVGGATLGYELARRGRRVLFVEKGRYLQKDPEAEQGELGELSVDPDERLRRGWWPHPISGRTDVEGRAPGTGWAPVRHLLDDGEADFFAPLGCGTGGSSVLYGATLERFHPRDFRPRENFPEVAETTLPEAWPVGWDTFAPLYEEVERLYDVHGTPDPLSDDEATLPEPPPMNEQDRSIHALFEKHGLHPYRSHIGCAFKPGCDGCGGRLCVRDCKGDSGRVCLVPAVETHGATLLSGCEVTRLVADRTAVREVHGRWQGRDVRLRAKVVVLAAGALMSPVLLMNSKSEAWPEGVANGSGWVGRNLMLHAGDMVAIRPKGRAEGGGFTKTISINDFYFAGGRKLGNFQSLGVRVDTGAVFSHVRTTLDKGPAWLRRIVPSIVARLIARVGAIFFRNAVVFSAILEDLPYLHNRVMPDASQPSGIRYEYTYPDELMERNTLFRRSLIRALGRRRVTVLSRPVNLNFGHVCGTCRFGDDPHTSVLDSTNRAHEVENLYVVDASFFPSSGGVNPSLTIAANALRVARIIDGRLGDAGANAGAEEV